MVFVLVDALRADHLGCYGYERPTSPSLDAVARVGTRFAKAITPAPWTLPAMATVWTSLYPSVHGATTRSNIQQWLQDREHFRPVSVLGDGHVTLAEVLQSEGFATAAFVDGSYPRRVFGFDQGFDTFIQEGWPGIRMKVEAALEWLDRTRPRRFFLYIHTVQVHSPYRAPQRRGFRLDSDNAHERRVAKGLSEGRERYAGYNFDPDYRGDVDGSWRSLDLLRQSSRPPEPDLRHLIALYDQGIAYTDYWLGRLVAGLQERGLQQKTALVVTADHGDEFFEHGGLEHGDTLYDELLSVPLIIRVPGVGEGVVVQEQVGLIDLMPTVLDLLAINYRGPMQGASLMPALRGQIIPPRTLFAEATMSGNVKASRTNDWKYLRRDGGSREELYDLRRDPTESNNLCAEERSRCAPHAEEMRRWEEEMRSASLRLGLPDAGPAKLDARTRERLRALGYALEGPAR